MKWPLNKVRILWPPKSCAWCSLMCRSIRSFDTPRPGNWTFEDWFVLIPSPGEKVVFHCPSHVADLIIIFQRPLFSCKHLILSHLLAIVTFFPYSQKWLKTLPRLFCNTRIVIPLIQIEKYCSAFVKQQGLLRNGLINSRSGVRWFNRWAISSPSPEQECSYHYFTFISKITWSHVLDLSS